MSGTAYSQKKITCSQCGEDRTEAFDAYPKGRYFEAVHRCRFEEAPIKSFFASIPMAGNAQTFAGIIKVMNAG